MIRRQITSRPRHSGHGPSWIGALLLLVLAVLAYLPATRCGFIWDDDDHLTANPCIVGPLGLKDIWTSAHARICPLVQTMFWLEYRLWGTNPLPYHLVNVLMHAVTAVVFWRVLLRLKVPGAWLGVALWMLHPVQVESVAWITEMKNTQSGLFFALTALCFCKSREAGPGDQSQNHNKFFYLLTMLFAAMAMASKSSTVVLPLVLGLCAWWMDGCWRWRRNVRQLTPLLLLSALAGVLSIWTQKIEGAGEDRDWALGGLERLVVAGRALWFYLGKLVWPHPLIMIYPRWEVRVSSVLAWLPLMGVVAITVVLWRNRNRWNGKGRAIWLAWAYFVVALLPVLGLLSHGFLAFSFVADHFQYLASIGPLVLVGAGLNVAFDRFKKPRRWFKAALSFLLLLGLGALTWRQCAMYQNQMVLWTATLAKNPSCWAAHNYLGNALQQEGRLEEAVARYQRALAIRPDYPEAHNNLGFILQTQGKLEEATVHYQKALEIIPDYGEAHRNFGVLLGRQGRIEEEVAHYQRALEINPDDAQSLNNLAYVLAASDNARVRNGARAVELAQRASRLTGGNDPSILGTLAAAQAEAGDFPAALETVWRAIRLAESQGNSRMSNLLRRHLKFYQEASPLRDKP